ncbi:MAG: M56 family metallopeptidase [Planctomycetaceae bacterium]|nr:M56 family metallopeptidase [Planctomycetaceae bacterium]
MMTIILSIVQAAIVSLLAGGVFWLVLRRFRGVSPGGHRLVWFGVLVLGLCIVRCPVNIPYYEPVPQNIVSQLASNNESRQLSQLAPPVDVQFAAQRASASQGDAANGVMNGIAENPAVTFNFLDQLPLAIIAAWLIGVLVLLVRRCVLFVQLHLRLHRLPQGTANDWARLLSQFGVAPERVPVLWTENTGPALVWSMSGYRLLFPRSLWDELSPAHREGVLRHELSHYLNGDAIVAELARLLATLQWFNPVAWVALRKLEEATEWRCDDFAWFHGERGPQDLIETLLAVHDSTESLGLYLSSFARINVITRIKRLQHTHFRKKNTFMRKTLLIALLLAFLPAATLQVRLVAKSPGEVAEPQTSEPVAVAATEEKQSDTLALALAMPETNDKERVEKFESLAYLLPWREGTANPDPKWNAKIEGEYFRVANSIELPTLRTEKLLACAWRYADSERWDEYKVLADQLDPLFKEMLLAYHASWNDVKAGHRDAAKERLLAFKPRILAMRHSYGSGVATVFCFKALAKLGFVDEVVEECKQVRASWNDPNLASRFDPQSKEDDYWEKYVIDRTFRNAIYDVGFDFIQRDELETALDFACKMHEVGKPYSAVTDPARSIMNTVVEKYVKKGEIDHATKVLDRIVKVVGNTVQEAGSGRHPYLRLYKSRAVSL